MGFLYSQCAGAVRWSGGTTVLRAGESISPDHPLAVERPDLFTTDEPEADIKMPAKPGRGASVPIIETATKAPDEKRQTRAPKKPATGNESGGSAGE